MEDLINVIMAIVGTIAIVKWLPSLFKNNVVQGAPTTFLYIFFNYQYQFYALFFVILLRFVEFYTYVFIKDIFEFFGIIHTQGQYNELNTYWMFLYFPIVAEIMLVIFWFNLSRKAKNSHDEKPTNSNITRY